VDFREGGVSEFLELVLVGVDVADPSVEEVPGLRFVVPDGAGGEDSSGEREGGGIEFEDGEIGEGIVVAIEELVVEDARRFAGAGLSEYPFFFRVEERLRRRRRVTSSRS